MKFFFGVLLTVITSHSYAFSVVDTMFDHQQLNRFPASQEGSYCLVNDDNKLFANSCYKTKELCSKRQEFWKDLPGANNIGCVKI